jgi:hypothetical protein
MTCYEGATAEAFTVTVREPLLKHSLDALAIMLLDVLAVVSLDVLAVKSLGVLTEVGP